MRVFLLIAAFAVALVFSLMSFMTVAAVLPELKAAWAMSNTETGLLGGILFGGYISAVLVLASLTDRIDPKRIYILLALIGGAASVALGLFADGLWSGLALRFLTGVGLGGTYMPGLRALTDQLPEEHRNRGVVYYSSFFALGSGLSVLIAGEIKDWLDWRWGFGIAGMGFFAAAAIIAAVLPANPPKPSQRPEAHPLDFRPVLRNRAAMGYIAGIVGATWEVFAYRVWAVAFLVMLAPRAPEGYLFRPTVMATVIAFVGIPASMALGELTARFDRRKLLVATAVLSVGFSIAVALAVEQSYFVLLALCLLLGMTSYGRNAATTSGMMAVADPQLRGATMALYAAIGFSGGIFGPLALGVALDYAGGRMDPAAWSAGFPVLAVGGVITAVGVGALVRARG